MGKFRVVIVDDEPLARSTTRLLLAKDFELEIVGEFGDGPSAVRFLNQHQVELLFLDIQMPGMSGFDVLASLDANRTPVVIFVTAYDKHAIQAFEVNALDYLLKPFDDERFDKAVKRAKDQLRQLQAGELEERMLSLIEGVTNLEGSAGSKTQALTRLMIKESGRVFFLKAEEVDWIEAADYYIKLHVGRKTHFLRETMNDIEAKLNQGQFIRVHRSAIVNVDRIKEMQQLFNGEYLVILRDGTEIKLSRSRRARIEAALTRGSSA